MAESHPIEEKKLVRVVIGVPNEGLTIPPAYDNHMEFHQHLGRLEINSQKPDYPGPRFGFGLFTAGRLLTAAAREALAEAALGANANYILMYDDDMIIPPDLFERLYRHDVDVVGALAFTRNPPHYPVIFKQEKGWDPVHQTDYFLNQHVRHYPKNALVKCDAIGFGAVLIKMDVIRKMRKPYFMSTTGSGEDIFFCYSAAQQANAKVYMDTSTILGHLGAPILIDEAYAENYWKTVEKKDVQKDHAQIDAVVEFERMLAV